MDFKILNEIDPFNWIICRFAYKCVCVCVYCMGEWTHPFNIQSKRMNTVPYQFPGRHVNTQSVTVKTRNRRQQSNRGIY